MYHLFLDTFCIKWQLASALLTGTYGDFSACIKRKNHHADTNPKRARGSHKNDHPLSPEGTDYQQPGCQRSSHCSANVRAAGPCYVYNILHTNVGTVNRLLRRYRQLFRAPGNRVRRRSLTPPRRLTAGLLPAPGDLRSVPGRGRETRAKQRTLRVGSGQAASLPHDELTQANSPQSVRRRSSATVFSAWRGQVSR